MLLETALHASATPWTVLGLGCSGLLVLAGTAAAVGEAPETANLGGAVTGRVRRWFMYGGLVPAWGTEIAAPAPLGAANGKPPCTTSGVAGGATAADVVTDEPAATVATVPAVAVTDEP